MEEKARSEYKLGWIETEKKERSLPAPHEMTYEAFAEEFLKVMDEVKKKEKKGGLDPEHPFTYKQMTEEDWALMAEDWKKFSRSMGYSAEDIDEYERWLVLSGQKDQFAGAINDPWRRIRPDQDKLMYLKHIQKAIDNGIELKKDVLDSIGSLKKELSDPIKVGEQRENVVLPVAASTDTADDDLW